MLLHTLRRRAAADRDSGVSLIVVISLTAVMLISIGAALTGATSGLNQAVAAQGATRALDAAYAGAQDYIAHLNADSTYTQYGNQSSTFSPANTVVAPRTANPAFSLDTGANSTWAPVPGSTNGGSFRYEVDNSRYGTSGLLRVRVTGRFGSFTRTIVASIQQQGFINYLYFTDFETVDPLITGASGCSSYLWSTASRDTNSCQTIQFGSKDYLAGPIRSNDTLTVCGATFNGSVTTSNPGTPTVQTPSGCSAGTYNAGAPVYAPVLPIPATNTAMKAQTYSDTASNPGCLYTGPTRITLNSDGTMTVVSPWTRATAVTSNGTASASPTPSYCGNIGALHSTLGATVQVPANNLVFVQGVPTTPSDPNYTATTAVPGPATGSWPSGTTYTCLGASAAAITGSNGSAGWTFTDSSGTIRYPLTNESPATNWSNTSNRSLWDTGNPAYGCRNGDVYVKGTMKGKLTIASDNYVYATGDITYTNSSSDILGLVGSNGVLVWNPLQGTSWYYTTPYGGTSMIGDTDRTIDAAILSPAHTFQVQNYNAGPARGSLTLLGSVAQRFRGTVGTGNSSGIATGYAKNYLYDARFSTVTPPYYLKPTSAAFKVGSYASTAAVFNSTGTVINP